MELAKTYSPIDIEAKWNRIWEERKCFRSTPDHREAYTVVIPPPNVTGVLHMGHILNNTIQDVLIRKARMDGKNACWVPGTDHASIATEAKVVAKLKAEGIDKTTLSKEEFLSHAWEWTDKHGGIILSQLKKMGASCDWDRNAFTMDENRSEAVKQVFIDLYRKGKIYRGYRMVHWDPQAKTSLSDEEVIYQTKSSKLYHVAYSIKGSHDTLMIATTRPETILADTAICVHPEDVRYQHLIGHEALVPMTNRYIPIIADDYVSMDFGTGCLKVTPAHDMNDYQLGIRHHLPIIDMLNEDGTLNQAGLQYAGMDRFQARKAIVKDLEAAGLLLKIEDYTSNVGTSERTGAVIEPRLSIQWYVKMKELAQPALDAVLEGEIQLIPEKFVNTYRYWMENVRDWCISRQLWWGHPIPAFYYGSGVEEFVVAEDLEEALLLAREKSGLPLEAHQLTQDPDALDTWFSSWLWPMSVFDGILQPKNPEFLYYYPTQVLVTAPEILFFWVARMVMAGYEYTHQKPFTHVYLHGIVRDHLGRKMSKSLGNSPDPLDLIDRYGADGVRMGMLLSAPAGNDILFDEKNCEQGRNFSNKIWNALRLVKGWEVADLPTAEHPAVLQWFEQHLNHTIAEVQQALDQFRLSDALMRVYQLIWDDFCSSYLEMIKPAFGQAIDRVTYEFTLTAFERAMQCLHPFMPFITEEVWHLLRDRSESDMITLSAYPPITAADSALLQAGERCRTLMTKIREIRNQQQLKLKDPIQLWMVPTQALDIEPFLEVIRRQCHVQEIHFEQPQQTHLPSIVLPYLTCFVDTGRLIVAEDEIDKMKKELEYVMGFISSVEAKLSNERFTAHAPAAVIEKEKQKLADGYARKHALLEGLSLLGVQNQ